MKLVHTKYKGYIITTRKTQLDPAAVHKWLSEKSWWAKGIEYENVKETFDNSFCIGIIYNKQQVGFARLVTDYRRFAYLMDVYVVEEHRGQGLGQKMIEALMDVDWVKNIGKIMLSTRDAHSLYEQLGFKLLASPGRMMERTNYCASNCI